MTTMTRALASAGVTLPSLKQRIWTWLRDNGQPKSTKQIGLALGVPHPRTSQECGVMAGRGMLVHTTEPYRIAGRRGHQVGSLYAAAGKEYELLSPSLAQREKVKAAQTKSAGRHTPTRESSECLEMPHSPGENQAPEVEPINLDDMTLRELRALYLRLRPMFEAAA